MEDYRMYKRDTSNITSIVWTSNMVIWWDTSTTSWDVVVSADDTNEALKVMVTWGCYKFNKFCYKIRNYWS